MPVKVFYVISDIQKALTFEWFALGIDRQQVELHFILVGKSKTPFITFLEEASIPHYVVAFDGKGDALLAWIRVFSILLKNKPDVVHTHLYYANLIGLTAAWCLRIKKRIYTRHHASIHHLYFPKSVFLDKIINFLSTDIIALCENLKEILIKWEGVREKKIHLIPHGFDLDYFEQTDSIKINSVRTRHNIPETYPVIGAVARLTKWKGVQFTIEAFRELLVTYPKAHLVLANATGDYEREIKMQLSKLPDKSYTLILFETESASMYRLFDLYVHVPIDAYCEAFGQTYVEALAVGVPSIFTLSGIGCDFIEHRKNAMVVSYENSVEIKESMILLLQDTFLRQRLIQEGRHSVIQKFAIGNVLQKLQSLYRL
ncbi:MAG: glycosyltransferase family 4 protein [Bacteroidia bacterium]